MTTRWTWLVPGISGECAGSAGNGHAAEPTSALHGLSGVIIPAK
jgi:hypothetical protein